MPQPYNRTELRALRATINERWPKLPRDEAERWLIRVKEDRSPYSRVRVHAIRCQLDAIVALALHQGLTRAQIFRASIHDVNHYNAGVVVRDRSMASENAREVPFTEDSREALRGWVECRQFLVPPSQHRPWLNLHSATTMRDPMTRHTFDKLLATYVGEGWSLKRLRDTCAAGWVRSGLPLEHLRRLLGLSRIEDALPYARLVRGSLDGEMAKRDELFTIFIEPGKLAA